MSKKINELNFIPFGGCSEIGMNLYAYVYNNQWILVDMGMGFDGAFGKELLVPSPNEIIKNKSKIKALLITHSHEDHIGAIPYLWPMIECPIYGRSFAIEMIRDKLFQFELDKIVPLIKTFPNRPVGFGDFSVEFIDVAHSTPEASALAITTPAGTIIHSGDWRLDDDPVLGAKTDDAKLKEYGDKGVLALICDSTNVFKNETYSSERVVRENLIKLAKKHKKHRLLVTCFASNLARLESCYYAAKESGRQLVIVGRSLKKIERVAKNAGYFTKIPTFLDERDISSLVPEKTLLVCTGSQGELGSALSKISNGLHKNIKLQNDDVVIFSSRIIPGNEKFVLGMQNILIDKGITIITDMDYEVHASGHPSKEELFHIYGLLKPNTLIPIHGEKMHLYKHAEIAKEYGIKNTIIPKDGDIISISKSKPEILDNVDSKPLAVDGRKLIPIDGAIYKHRELLSQNGVVSICVRCSNESIKIIDILSCGVFETQEQDDLYDIQQDISAEIKIALGGIIKNKRYDKEKIQSSIKKIIKTIFANHQGKSPIAIVHVID